MHGVRPWRHFRRIDREVEQHTGSIAELKANGGRLTIEDRALYIYTSGTTGLPKAANVSHARVMQWSHWFAGMMDAQPTDRMYNCLPMYHSVGGVLAPGAVLVGGGSVVIREKFSASQFWSDVDALGLHAVPVYRRALPILAPRRALSARGGRIGFEWPAATA